eukprot:7736559-Heterocapsa_arctica.AAC.1
MANGAGTEAAVPEPAPGATGIQPTVGTPLVAEGATPNKLARPGTGEHARPWRTDFHLWAEAAPQGDV